MYTDLELAGEKKRNDKILNEAARAAACIYRTHVRARVVHVIHGSLGNAMLDVDGRGQTLV